MTGVVAVIPARFGSTRLPGKPLLRETGFYLIQHVYARVCEARLIDRVIIATDDQRIVDAVRSFDGDVIMTSSAHVSGTDRVAEVIAPLAARAVINVQGDEPEIDPLDLDRLADAILEPGAEIATLAIPLTDAASFANPHHVKVVCDAGGHALYFSRAPIPWRDAAPGDGRFGLKHLGVYAYTRDALLRFTAHGPCGLETCERLEQLRALHHGMRIRVLPTDRAAIGIDTESDYREFITRWRKLPRTSP